MSGRLLAHIHADTPAVLEAVRVRTTLFILADETHFVSLGWVFVSCIVGKEMGDNLPAGILPI